MTRIVVDNVWSTLEADPEVLKTVRHHVAYRSAMMPPVEAQHIIKSFFARSRRYGTLRDINRMWSDGATASALLEAGLKPNDLTTQMFEATLRQRGVWDGWVRMMKITGKFPTGLVGHVIRALKLRAGTTYTVDDNRGEPPYGQLLSSISLFPFQEQAVQAFLESYRGVVDLPPRSGKTRIAISIVARLGLPTLYVTPGVGLVNQTVAAFRDLLPEKLVVGQTGRPNIKEMRRLSRALVWVSTPQTAVTLPNVGARKLLVIDEFHHAAAKTWQAVAQAAHGAFWRLGLTGTHYRADGRDLEMAGVLGRAVYQRSVSEMVQEGRLVPAKIAMLRIPGTLDADGKTCYRKGIVEYQPRHKILTDAANALVQRGCRVLVLTKEIGHAELLSSMIPGSAQVDGRDNAEVDQRLRDLEARKVTAVVGTSVIGEGRDVPAADALIYAAGGKSKVKVKQDYFRVLTASVGKKAGIIVDAADTHHSTLLDHSAHRLVLYREEDVFCAEAMNPAEFGGWLKATME